MDLNKNDAIEFKRKGIMFRGIVTWVTNETLTVIIVSKRNENSTQWESLGITPAELEIPLPQLEDLKKITAGAIN